MRIGSISSVMNNSKPAKVQSKKNDNVSFKSAYADIYKWAEKEKLPNLAAVQHVFNVLWDGALKREGMKTTSICIAKTRKDTGRNSFLGALIDSYRLNCEKPRPVICNPSNGNVALWVNGRELTFENPESKFKPSIAFWLKRDFWNERFSTVEVSRKRDFNAYYYDSGRLKEHFDVIEDGGGMINHCYYNEDGTKSFWKNMLF